MVSNHLRTFIEDLKIKIGTDVVFTQCSHSKYGPLVTHGWVKLLWLVVSTLPIKIKLKSTASSYYNVIRTSYRPPTIHYTTTSFHQHDLYSFVGSHIS